MWYLLVDLYKVYLYDASGVKSGPAPGVTIWNIGTKNPIFKILLLWKWKAWSFDILFLASTCGPLSNCSYYDARSVITGPAPGFTIWNIETKKPIFKMFLLCNWKLYGFDI